MALPARSGSLLPATPPMAAAARRAVASRTWSVPEAPEELAVRRLPPPGSAGAEPRGVVEPAEELGLEPRVPEWAAVAGPPSPAVQVPAEALSQPASAAPARAQASRAQRAWVEGQAACSPWEREPPMRSALARAGVRRVAWLDRQGVPSPLASPARCQRSAARLV